MKIPKLQSAISALVSNAEVLSSIPPDEVISIGCANQAVYVHGDGDEDGEQVEMEITTLPTDICVGVVGDNNQLIGEQLTLFRKGATVPSAHGVTLPLVAKAPVKLSVIQGDHRDYIESNADKDSKEIVGRAHGGVRLNNAVAAVTEPASIHIHLN